MFNTLTEYRDILDCEFTENKFIADSGYSAEVLEKDVRELFHTLTENETPHCIIKARCFEHILLHAQIGVLPQSIFAERLNHAGLINKICRDAWTKEEMNGRASEAKKLAEENGKHMACEFWCDFGHVSPDWEQVVRLGFSGLLSRLVSQRDEKKRGGRLTQSQNDFYESGIITYKAVMAYLERLRCEVERISAANPKFSENLCSLSKALTKLMTSAPSNLYEGLITVDIMFYLLELVMGTRTRTLGGLDRVLYSLYENDIESGLISRDEESSFVKQSLFRMSAMRIPYGLPFMLGGLDSKGNDVINELSYIIVREYTALNIHNPKIHIRVNDKTPKDFILLVLDSIRKGSSSFVFCNDKIGVEMLERIGISTEDARIYTPIGCYEPASAGKEAACTGSGRFDLARVVNLALCGGFDTYNNVQIGAKTETEFADFDDFYSVFEEQFRCLAEINMKGMRIFERSYGAMNPEPLLSGGFDNCVMTGTDLYDGGAKYNNSSFSANFLPSCVDGLAAIKTAVFDRKLCSAEELRNALKSNFKGYEKLRTVLQKCDKYGNNLPLTNELSSKVAKTVTNCINGKPNGRGGVFKLGGFSIDHHVSHAKFCGATADGRLDGTPLAKNLCAMPSMDKEGLTALIESATAFDHAAFPNGIVLDIVLHPSAVSGENGLMAFYGILMTYFSKGGFAFQANVFDSSVLKDAQLHPDKYMTLQVRVCGWNVTFINLSKAEQDIFIKQAENFMSAGA